MAGPTPGPWYPWLPGNADTGCREIRTEAGRARGSYHGTVTAVTSGLANDEEDEANAALIAAAPDLLRRAEDLLETVEAYGLAGELDAGCDGEGPVEMMQAAITNAKKG